jgi:hypothetical protein
MHPNILENRQLPPCADRHSLAFSRQMRWRTEPMPKRENGYEPKKDRPMPREAAPPLLSDKLIAQLQDAVSAAQRRRMPDLNDSTAGSPEKEI